MKSPLCHSPIGKITSTISAQKMLNCCKRVITLAALFLIFRPTATAQLAPILLDSGRVGAVDILMDTVGLVDSVFPNGPLILERLWAKHAWAVVFRVNATHIPKCDEDSVIEIGWNDLDTNYPSLRSVFRGVDSQYSGCSLRKAVPSDTSAPTGQTFYVYLGAYANVATIDSLLNGDTNLICAPMVSFPYGQSVPSDLGVIPLTDVYSMETGIDNQLNSRLLKANFHRLGWQWGLRACNFPLAWDITRGSKDIVIAERGQWFYYELFTHAHPEYTLSNSDDIKEARSAAQAGNFVVLDGSNCGNGLHEVTPRLVYGHEAQCSAVAISRADNVTSQEYHNLVGACPECVGIASEIFSSAPDDRVPATNALYRITGLDIDFDAANNGSWRPVSVMNVSSTGEYDPNGYGTGLIQQGIIVVATAGNEIERPDVKNPAAHVWADKFTLSNDYKVIAVGGTQDGNPTECSCGDNRSTLMVGKERSVPSYNFSPGYWKFGTNGFQTVDGRATSEANAFIDLVAPSITAVPYVGTALNGPAFPAAEFTGFNALQSGTSFAAPLVSGTCGLMLSICPFMGVSHGVGDGGRPLFGAPYDGADVQRRAYNILTMTADKIDDDDVLAPNVDGSKFIVHQYVAQGVDGIQPDYFDKEYSSGQDYLNRSWAQRMGFGRLNAFRAVAQSIASKAAYSYDANSEDLIFDAVDQAVSPSGKKLIHMGAWKDANHTLLPIFGQVPAAGGRTFPDQPSTHNNNGETKINSSEVSTTGTLLHVPFGSIAAIDGILTTDHPQTTDQAVHKIATVGDGLILETGYLSNVQVVGNVHASDLVVDGSSGKVSGIVIPSGSECVLHNKITMLGSGKIRVSGGTAQLESGCDLNMMGSEDLAITDGGHVEMKTICSIVGGWDHEVNISSANLSTPSQLTIRQNAIVTIDAIVSVQSGGELVIEEGARLKLKGFTVEANGKITLKAGAVLSLMEPSYQNTCSGLLVSNETNSGNRPRITGKLDNCCYVPCESIVDYAVLISDGDPTNPANNHVILTNTDLSDIQLRGRFDINGQVAVLPNTGVKILASTANATSVWLHKGALAGSKLVNYGAVEVQSGAVVVLGVEVLNNGEFKSLASSTHRTTLQSEMLPLVSAIRSGVNGATSQVEVEYTNVTNVQFQAINKATGHFSNNAFVMQANATTRPPSSCIALYGLSQNSIDIFSNTFSTFSSFNGTYGQSTHCDTAIAVNAVLPQNGNPPPPIERIFSNVGASGTAGIRGFRIGVAINNGSTSLENNTIGDCSHGVYARGMGITPILKNNQITGYGTGSEGIRCVSANPYVLHNTIAANRFGVYAFQSSPFIACNTITSSVAGSVGVYGSPASSVRMGTDDVRSKLPAQNHLKRNSGSQIELHGQSVVMLDGKNEISIDNQSPPCAALAGAVLMSGTPKSDGSAIDATGNWWGCVGGNSPWLSCAAPFNVAQPPVTVINLLPVSTAPPPGDCDAQTVDLFGTTNCYPNDAYFNSQSGHFNDPCDSLVALYMKEINCGACDSAIAHLEEAIEVCDPNSVDEITALLQRVLWFYGDCKAGSIPAGLPDILTWIHHYAQSTSHDSNRIVARWMEGVAYGMGHYFSKAIAVFDSIGALGLPVPFDSTTSFDMSETYHDMMNVIGDLTFESLGKISQHSAGRLGSVPDEVNILHLHVAPNPFGARTTAMWEIPVEDADDVVDVTVHDMMVNMVAHPIHDFQTVGKHQIEIDGSKLPSGRYIVAVHTRNHQQSKLLILSK
jgi:hypothetical protein